MIKPDEPKFRFPLQAVAAILAVFAMGPLCLAGSPGELQIDQVKTFGEMEAALSVLGKSLSNDAKGQGLTYELQKEILTRSGECISRLAYLCQENRYDPDTVRQTGKILFSANRDIIRQILTTNEEIIRRFQEETLDTIEDAPAFFQTPQWQHPQQLISLSSYWLGWNGYYASLVIPEEDPVRRQMLMESVEGFSRAFIDFEEKNVIAKSLYGRGLCYRQLKDFQNAIYDFKAVKDRVEDDDLLLARCLFEEALISYETGNLKVTLEKMDQIRELFGEDDMPEHMVLSMAELRANVLMSKLEKETGRQDAAEGALDESFLDTFRQMKQLAVNLGSINESFYRYVQSNAAELETLSYDELGPVAALAIGDWYYAKEAYDPALSWYKQVLADTSLTFSQNLDRLMYRAAHIYYQKEQWPEVVRLMGGFHDAYPRSQLAKQAASLYYAAAASLYRDSGEGDAYETYIDSIQAYLAFCDNCNGRSEARFQLGRYYRRRGDAELADAEFSAVEEDSPNFFQAKYYVLETCVEQLDMLSQKGRAYAGEMLDIYRRGVGVIDDCSRAAPDGGAAESRKKLEPYMAVLQARLHLHGGEDAWGKGFQLLEGFQTKYPLGQALFLDAAKLRIEYCVRLQKDRTFEAEVNAFIETTPVDPSRYAGLHDLANKFFTESKRSEDETETSLPGRYALAALGVYEKLHTISLENASYSSYCDPIELRMAQICMNESRIDRAAELYGNVLRRDPQSADAVYGLGLIYEQQGRWQEALQTWRKFSDGVEAGTYHWFQSRYRTAVALHQLGETDRACTVVTMTRVLHPDFGDDELAAKFKELEAALCKGETKK